MLSPGKNASFLQPDANPNCFSVLAAGMTETRDAHTFRYSRLYGGFSSTAEGVKKNKKNQ